MGKSGPCFFFGFFGNGGLKCNEPQVPTLGTFSWPKHLGSVPENRDKHCHMIKMKKK